MPRKQEKHIMERLRTSALPEAIILPAPLNATGGEGTLATVPHLTEARGQTRVIFVQSCVCQICSGVQQTYYWAGPTACSPCTSGTPEKNAGRHAIKLLWVALPQRPQKAHEADSKDM